MDSNLGNIIKNGYVRAGIYGAYVIGALVIGGLDVWFGDADPSWIAQAQSVIAYLAIPVGGLAAVNSRIIPTNVIAPEAEVIIAGQATTIDEAEEAVG